MSASPHPSNPFDDASHDPHPLVRCDEFEAEAMALGHTGLLQLTAPPENAYRDVLQSNLLTDWQTRIAAELSTPATLTHGYHACHRLERALRAAQSSAEAALCARLARAVGPLPPLIAVVQHTAEKEVLRNLLQALQHAVHAADFPWHVHATLECDLSPWRAHVVARVARWRDTVSDRFMFLSSSTFTLRATHTEPSGHVIEVAYAPRSEPASSYRPVWQQPFPGRAGIP